MVLTRADLYPWDGSSGQALQQGAGHGLNPVAAESRKWKTLGNSRRPAGTGARRRGRKILQVPDNLSGVLRSANGPCRTLRACTKKPR